MNISNALLLVLQLDEINARCHDRGSACANVHYYC